MKIIHSLKPLEEKRVGSQKNKKVKNKKKSNLEKEYSEAKSCSQPSESRSIASEVAQRPRVESRRLSPRNYKTRPSLPVSWGSRSNVASPEEKSLGMKPRAMFNDPATPLWFKDSSERKTMTLACSEQCYLPPCRIGCVEGRKLLTLHNLEEKNKASDENAGNWMKL